MNHPMNHLTETRRPQAPSTTLLALAASAALLAATPAQADTGKLLLTGGVSTVEGAAGGGISPWAVIGSQATEGEVRKLDRAQAKVTIRHGEIKNLDMPPMQMSFRVSDPAWLQSVQVGDKIRFTADKVNGQYTITTLEKK